MVVVPTSNMDFLILYKFKYEYYFFSFGLENYEEYLTNSYNSQYSIYP